MFRFVPEPFSDEPPPVSGVRHDFAASPRLGGECF
jgi:hypothetical protein